MNGVQLCNQIENILLNKYGTLYKASKALSIPLPTLQHLHNNQSLVQAIRIAERTGIALKVEVI